MKFLNSKNIAIFALLALLTLSFSCKENADNSTEVESANSTEVQADLFSKTLFSKEAVPEDLLKSSITVAEARKKFQENTPVVIKAKAFGAVDIFVEGRAVMTVGDFDKLTSCDLRAGDNCKTPWDACCDSKEDLSAYTANIQVLDTDGLLVKQGLKGMHGLKELSQVLIVGKVAAGSSEKNLNVNAEKIYFLNLLECKKKDACCPE